MYWAFELSPETRNRIISLLFKGGITVPKDWTPYCDHITVAHQKNVSPEYWESISKLLRNFEGRGVVFTIESFAKNDKVMAVGVSTGSLNKHAHITIACAPEVKPFESNNLKEWSPVLCLEDFKAQLVLKE